MEYSEQFPLDSEDLFYIHPQNCQYCPFFTQGTKCLFIFSWMMVQHLSVPVKQIANFVAPRTKPLVQNEDAAREPCKASDPYLYQ